jgi:hypothetical protein
MPDIGDNSAIEIDAAELQRLLDELECKKKAVTEATGALRARLKEILDDTGWHKGALQTIRQIASMSETKRADFLRTFEQMFDALMEHGWRQEMVDLLDARGEDADG